MIKTVVAVLFVLVLVIDFIAEVNRKHINVAELLVRAFMVLACAYLMQGM